MIHPWTCVVSYHTDHSACGVAKFGAELAFKLGVPMIGINRYAPLQDISSAFALHGRPLFSLKWAELDSVVRQLRWQELDVLWHDTPELSGPVTGRHWSLPMIGVPALVRPSTLELPALFTFGMANKIEVEMFRALRLRMPPCQLWISTATHEGAGPSRVPELMDAWGPTARNLGTLTDEALGLIWPRVSALVAFFAGGLRANNTTVHAALDAGVPVITNHGLETPEDLKAVTRDYHGLTCIRALPTGPSPYTWERLLEVLCDPSH